MVFTLTPRMVQFTKIQISNFVQLQSLKPWFAEGSQLLGSVTGIQNANYARYAVPTLNGVKTYQEFYDEIAAEGSVKTTITNRVTEIGITLKEYVTDTQRIRMRDLQQIDSEEFLSRFVAGMKESITAATNMTILETLYNQTKTGRLAEGATATAATVRGSVVDTSAWALLPSDTDVQMLTKSNLFANALRNAIADIQEIKSEEGQSVDFTRLSLIISPQAKRLLSYNPLQLYSPTLVEASFSKGLIGTGTFYGIPIKETNQLDVPITQRNGGLGKSSVLAVIAYAGAMACPFVFEGQLNYDKVPGSDVYKLNGMFNTGSGVIFPYLMTIFANCGTVSAATATAPAKSGMTAQDRVIPANINLTKVVVENLATVRDSTDPTNPAGATANPAKATDLKGK